MGRNNRDRRNCQRKLCHPHYLSALLHARKLGDDNLIIYPCRFGCHLHVGHMKQLTTNQKKKARLGRKIAQTRQQLAQLRRNLQKLLAEEAKSPTQDQAQSSEA